ncbi:MAG TPA: MFS transporter [Kofleriaceae bacterium]|nr:MFS transporter [Kofleriaceae bacterium]
MPPVAVAASEPARTSRWESWKRLDRRVWQMAIARAVNTMGLSLVMSFLGVYVVETRDYPAWLYGVIALVANLGQSMANAWAGNLSDRIGRRPLVTGSLVIRSAVIAALGTQILLDAPLWSLALNMLASSMLRGCFEPVAYALVADVCAPDQRIAAFGLQRMGTNVGWAVGPAVGGLLSAFVPYGVVFYVAAAGLLVAARLTMRVIDPRPRAKTQSGGESMRDAIRAAAADPLMRVLLVGSFLASLLQTQLFSTFAVFMTDHVGMSKASVGLLYTVNGLTVLLLQIPALGLIRRLGVRITLVAAPCVYALGFFLVGQAVAFASGALAITVITCAEIIFDPSHQTAIAEIADPLRRGRAFGVVGMAQLVGVAFGPLTGGILLDTMPSATWIWACIATIGLAQAATFALFVRLRRR